jgi:hypothetical protein
MRKNRRARLYENVLQPSSVESSLVSLILTIECGINNVNHVFNMSLDKLYSLEYDNKVSSGGIQQVLFQLAFMLGLLRSNYSSIANTRSFLVSKEYWKI